MSQSETLLTCEDSAVQSGDKPCCRTCCESIFGSGENNQNFIDCGAGCDNECRAPINLDICEDLGLNFSAGLPGINPLSDIEEALCCLFPENDENAAFVQSVPLNSQSCTQTNSPTESPTESPTDFPTRLPTKSSTDFPTRLPTESPTLEIYSQYFLLERKFEIILYYIGFVLVLGFSYLALAAKIKN
eukprot:snap_masked-scaffold_45-processed-gene-1.45-mRNA-1 protein AED:1.00 eAED:1.00 QI:0/-1/0/0/-1/1/1/0/187